MFGWLAVAALGALGISAHVRNVSRMESRAAAVRASLATPRGQALLAATTNAGAFIRFGPPMPGQQGGE